MSNKLLPKFLRPSSELMAPLSIVNSELTKLQ